MSRRIWLTAWIAGLTCGACSDHGAIERPAGPATDWTTFGGAPGGGHFSAAGEITPGNVSALTLAWTHRSGDVRQPPASGAGQINGALQQSNFEVTPIVSGDTLYYCTPFNRVFALDAATGKERWVFDPHVKVEEENVTVCRGVSLWKGEGQGLCAARIFTGTLDGRLLALDAASGKPCEEFGDRGTVDLNVGLTPHGPREYDVTSPPAILGRAVIVGGLVADSFRKDVPAGVVRAFDAGSGALLWAFNPVPPGEPDRNPDGTFRASTVNVWSIMSVDVERNLVFLPTGNAGPDFFGGDRAGFDYYASSIVALDGATGKPVWHFQVVHHDLWDYDVPAEPTLVDLTIDGQKIPTLVQVTKMGLTFVLNRETGAPLFPVVERLAPQDGVVAGEHLSPTQPVPTLPTPLNAMTFGPDEAWGFTFWDRNRCRDTIAALNHEGLYTPPSLGGSVLQPSTLGGNDWGSPAIDPERKVMVVSTNHIPMSVRLVPRAQCAAVKGLDYPQTGSDYCAVVAPVFSPWGAPCSKPPWATISAVDLESGKILWTRAHGELGPAARWPMSTMDGGFSIGGPAVTKTGLIFIGASTDPALRAYSIENGEELWKAELPTSANSVPMSYRLGANGRQFVVVAAGGHFAFSGIVPAGDYLMAFALPER
ncbi:MAG TPA: pyrroloquinoline quinone-dependent dehydrogenase [Steroidobacteraceae bacterium]|nr:pyrroloquinoline quinone-dependent dehydrogenase [Steroidobacteraceae bacterium]